MTTALALITPPSKDVISLAEMKAWAKIDHNEEDALLASIITAATESAEQFTNRSLLTQTWRLTLDLHATRTYDNLPGGVYDLPVTALYGGLPDVISLPRLPLQSVTSVTTYNTANTGTVFASSNYYVDTANGRIVLNQSSLWPSNLRNRSACVIDYVAGYGDSSSSVPQAIRTAILMHAQKMYDGRIICEMPESCERLLRQYKVYGRIGG